MQLALTAQKLEDARKLRRFGQWRQAEATLNELSQTLPQFFKTKEPVTADEMEAALEILREKARLYEQSGINSKCWAETLQLVQVLEKRCQAPLAQQARTLWKMHLCAKRNDYVAYHLQGEPHLHEAIALFKEPSTYNDPTYLNLLGWQTAFRSGELEKALKILDSALNAYSHCSGAERQEDMAFTYQLLSLAYDENGIGDKLRLFLERGRALSQAMQEPAELADLLTFSVARQAVEPEFALDGLKWIEKNFGERHPKLLVLRTAIAARLENEAMEGAESYWLDSLEKCDDPPMGHCIYALTGYAGYLERKERQPEAEEHYRKALAIIESYFQPEPLFFLGPQPALALSELLVKQKRFPECEILLKSFIERQDKDDYVSELDIEYALEILINILNELGRSDETEPYKRKLNRLQGLEP